MKKNTNKTAIELYDYNNRHCPIRALKNKRKTPMIFLCFTVKDRTPLINDFNQYLFNFGLDTWYDRKNIFLGDKRKEVNIDGGVKNKDIKYAIIFYSDNFPKGNICKDEFDILVDRYNKGEVWLFPVFLHNVPKDLDTKYSICKILVYKTLSSANDFLPLALHIVAKITHDMLNQYSYKKIDEIMQHMEDGSIYKKMLNEYEIIDKNNYAMRIGMLYSYYIFLTSGKQKDPMFDKSMNYIFHNNCSSIFQEERRELQIMENIIALTINSIYPNMIL